MGKVHILDVCGSLLGLFGPMGTSWAPLGAVFGCQRLLALLLYRCSLAVFRVPPWVLRGLPLSPLGDFRVGNLMVSLNSSGTLIHAFSCAEASSNASLVRAVDTFCSLISVVLP